jgi:hypothetical protein
MSTTFLEAVVEVLRVPGEDQSSASEKQRVERDLFSYSHLEWVRRIGVLDRTGLTLPLYARMLANGNWRRLPLATIKSLESRRRDNETRMLGMLETFGRAVRALQHAQIQFVCVKGFSLFPEFLDEPWQRHQIDFDLLVAPSDALRAQAALEELGYRLTAVTEDGERRLRIPVKRALSHDAYLYQPQEGGAIELHSRFWESGAEDLPLDCPDDAFAKKETHTLGSVSFPCLSLHHAFLYQVLHVFRHFLGSWARPLWLYEIANFVDRHRDDDALWERIDLLLQADARLAQAFALVLQATKELFACSIPPALEAPCTLPDDSPIRLWIDHYARRWILTDMPGNKLNLLLQRHFFSDRGGWRRYLAGRLVPRGKRSELCEGIDQSLAKGIQYRVASLCFRAARVWHHVRTNGGLAAASIAWRMRLRAGRHASRVIELGRSHS